MLSLDSYSYSAMDLLLLLCFVGFHLQAIDGSVIAAEAELPRSRNPRKILRKIHSGIAFLAGVKVGSLLSSKGFDIGHGSLAASNTFQFFGKPVSSAISLAYGGAGQKLPLLDEVPPASNETAEKATEDIVHVTVVRNPSPDTIDKLRRIANVTVADTNQINHDVVVFESDDTTTAAAPVESDEVRFVREHNRRVSEINRRNSRF